MTKPPINALPGTLRQKGLIIVGLPTILQFAFIAIIVLENKELERHMNTETHYRNLMTTVSTMSLDSFRICAELHDLMAGPDAEALQNVSTHLQSFNAQVHSLRESGKVDRSTAQLCDDLSKTAEELSGIFSNAGRILSNRLNMSSALELYGYRTRFEEIVPVFLEQHQELLHRSVKLSAEAGAAGNRAQKTRHLQRNCVVAAAVGSAVLAFAIANVLSREIRQRLNVIKENTLRLSQAQPLLGPVNGEDEIRDLDNTFREMAAALVRAREKEHALVTESQDMICSLDPEGRIELFNPATLAILGKSADDVSGALLCELIETDCGMDLSDALESGKSALQNLEVAVHKAGGTVHLSMAVHWSQNQQRFFVAAHDITRRKELERLQRELYAMIAHDVRSPLMSAKLSIELCRLGAPDGNTRLLRAERSLERLTFLINDLLDMEKIRSGKFDICPEKKAALSVVESAIDAVHGLIEDKQIHLHKRIEDINIYADADLISRVLFNLLSNAIKFSTRGSTIELTVSVEGDQARFSVKDDGPGISAADQAKLFDRFVQLSQPEGSRLRGTGLGLAICKMVVEEHDGKLGIISEPGKGSEFWFTLPLVAQYSNTQSAREEPGRLPSQFVQEA